VVTSVEEGEARAFWRILVGMEFFSILIVVVDTQVSARDKIV
jgi:hypothetical protein